MEEDETRYIATWQNQQAVAEGESLLSKLFDTVLETGSEVAKTIAAGQYGYQPVGTGPGGVYPSGKYVPVSVAGQQGFTITPGMLIIVVVVVGGLWALSRSK